MMNSAALNAIAGLGLGGVVIAGVNSLPEIWRDIETGFWPVVVVTEVVPVHGQGINFHVYGNKVRTCEYLDTKGYAATKDGPSVEVRFEYVDDVTPSSTRPKGEQDFGVWRWHASGISNLTGVFAIVEHQCGLLVPTRTKVGPFPIEPAQ